MKDDRHPFGSIQFDTNEWNPETYKMFSVTAQSGEERQEQAVV